MTDCVFCKIVKREIPCSKVYEDKKVLAFLDITPVNKGHVLVIPKAHHENILDIPEGLLREVIAVVKKVAPAVKKGVEADGISIGQSNGKAANQLVPHIHFHIMPRFDDDGLRSWPHKNYEKGEMDEYARKIVSFVH
jgi:histidine triad (HIT) family protein